MVLPFSKVWEFFLMKSLKSVNYILDFTNYVVKRVLYKSERIENKLYKSHFFMVDKESPFEFKNFKIKDNGVSYSLDFHLEYDESVDNNLSGENKSPNIEDKMQVRFYEVRVINGVFNCEAIFDETPDDFFFSYADETLTVICDKWYIGKVFIS